MASSTAVLLQKLKQENATLKEALEQAHASDIALLKSRLRGAQADIAHYQQLNTELKDRIQGLEDKLFKALAEKYDNNNSNSYSITSDDYNNNNHKNNHNYNNSNNNYNTSSNDNFSNDENSSSSSSSVSNILKEKLRRKQLAATSGIIQPSEHNDSQLTNDSILDSTWMKSQNQQVRLTDGVKSSFAALQNRCRHLESLKLSYEKTISTMQDEILAMRPNLRSVPEKSVSFNESMDVTAAIDDQQKDSISLTTTQKTKTKMSENIKIMISQAREMDQKTIQELAKEVKRLTGLVPRQMIDESESESPDSEMNTAAAAAPQTEQSITPNTVETPVDTDMPTSPLINDKKDDDMNFTKLFWIVIKSSAALIVIGILLVVIIVEGAPIFLT